MVALAVADNWGLCKVKLPFGNNQSRGINLWPIAIKFMFALTAIVTFTITG